MPLEKRSFSLSGHRTSVALEPAFWAVLERMADDQPLAALVQAVDRARAGPDERLASALRVTALTHLQTTRLQADDAPKNGVTRQEQLPCPAPLAPQPRAP